MGVNGSIIKCEVVFSLPNIRSGPDIDYPFQPAMCAFTMRDISHFILTFLGNPDKIKNNTTLKTRNNASSNSKKNLISNALILIGMSLIFVGLIKLVKPYGATTTTTTSNEENLILFFEILILAEKEKAKEKQRGRENR
uniref:Uncharacterized protein n=1 Tax=Glossina austeni TaxID=7395 RepID=A0A1A9UGC4_GLOAU